MAGADQIARAVIGAEWAGSEWAMEARYLAEAPGDPATGWLPRERWSSVWFWIGEDRPQFSTLVEPTREQWSLAYERWAWHFRNFDALMYRKDQAVTMVRKLAERAELEVFARESRTGEMVPIPAARWNCDRDIAAARLARGRINMRDMMAPLPDDPPRLIRYLASMDSWLFVSLSSLRASVGKHGASVALEAVKQSVGAETAAETWLRQRFSDSETAKIPKPDFRNEAQQLYPGLSGKGFERVWAKAAKDFPERSQKGSRGNRRP
jgi:hypothetical protein